MKLRPLVRAAVIAALYVTLCLAFAPISYGALQIRVSEAFALLPVLCPEAVLGVTLGCFLANMIASNPVDMVVGTSATLLAALATRKLRNVRWRKLAILPSLPPVVFNALIIGALITYFETSFSGFFWPVFGFNAATVGLGQLISCSVLGVALVRFIESKPGVLRLFQDKNTISTSNKPL